MNLATPQLQVDARQRMRPPERLRYARRLQQRGCLWHPAGCLVLKHAPSLTRPTLRYCNASGCSARNSPTVSFVTSTAGTSAAVGFHARRPL